MNERTRSYLERPRRVVGFAFLVLALVGCNGAIAINENTIWYGSERMRNDPRVVEHEACHQQQMKDIGGANIFWKKYLDEDNAFRCQSELACGETEEHFACQDIKLRIEPELVSGDIIALP